MPDVPMNSSQAPRTHSPGPSSLLCFALLCFALLCFALLCFALLIFANILKSVDNKDSISFPADLPPVQESNI